MEELLGDGESSEIAADRAMLDHDAAREAKLRALAVALYAKACEDGDLESCSSCATDLVAKKDWGAARRYAEKGCDGDEADCCKVLAGLYDEGVGVPKDPKRAAALFAKACGLGSIAACSRLK